MTIRLRAYSKSQMDQIRPASAARARNWSAMSVRLIIGVGPAVMASKANQIASNAMANAPISMKRRRSPFATETENRAAGNRLFGGNKT